MRRTWGARGAGLESDTTTPRAPPSVEVLGAVTHEVRLSLGSTGITVVATSREVLRTDRMHRPFLENAEVFG